MKQRVDSFELHRRDAALGHLGDGQDSGLENKKHLSDLVRQGYNVEDEVHVSDEAHIMSLFGMLHCLPVNAVGKLQIHQHRQAITGMTIFP